MNLLSPGFGQKASVQLVVVQLSLLTRNTFVISFGIPARALKVRLGGNIIDFAIESFSCVLESSHVKWYTDSQVLDVGSMNPDLHKLAIKIFGASLRSKINLGIQWTLRTENEKADIIRRVIYVDDWHLTDRLYATGDILQRQRRKILLEILES